MRELFFSRAAIPTWIALAALFVALGGPAAAGDLVSGKKIPGKKIKAETITAKQVKNGTLTEVELSPATAAALRAVGPDSVTGASVADASLGGADLADGAVDGSDLADGAVDGSDLADDAIDGAKVRNRSLGVLDVGRYGGRLVGVPFGVINNGTCGSVTTPPLVPVPNGQDLRDDAIAITPSAGFPTGVTVTAQPVTADTFTITLCNLSGGNLAAGSKSFQYVTIDTSGQ